MVPVPKVRGRVDVVSITQVGLELFHRLHRLVSVFLGDGAERTSHDMNLEDDKSDPLTVTFVRIEKNTENVLSVKIVIDGIDENLGDIFVLHIASCTVRRTGGETRTRRDAVGACSDSHSALIPGTYTTCIHLA